MDDSKPYSLGVVSTLANLPKEVLFGRRGEHFQWGAQVYRNVLPADFFASGGDMGFDVSKTLTKVIGDCNGGAWQKYVGYVTHPDVFFFRDVDKNDVPYGLFADGWSVNNEVECDRSGDLNKANDGSRTNGMIFVR